MAPLATTKPANFRGPLTVHAVATPPRKAAGRKHTGLAATSAGQAADQSNQQASVGRALVAENNLHNSFYLPYHYVNQDNYLMHSGVDAKTYDAYESSWSGSSYL
jgi:hypothetical protein